MAAPYRSKTVTPVTRLQEAAHAGDAQGDLQGDAQLLPLLYAELRNLAAAKLAVEQFVHNHV
jgi:hypothetical protein